MTDSIFDYYSKEAAQAGREAKRQLQQDRVERFLPQPNTVYCSQCGGEFLRYLRATGYSHCEDHILLKNRDDNV